MLKYLKITLFVLGMILGIVLVIYGFIKSGDVAQIRIIGSEL